MGWNSLSRADLLVDMRVMGESSTLGDEEACWEASTLPAGSVVAVPVRIGRYSGSLDAMVIVVACRLERLSLSGP
jgi:hypothetical protein